MAKKPTINTIGSGYASKALLNTNFEALRDGFDNTLSLDGSAPNAMAADLDLNSNNITNVNTLNGTDATALSANLDIVSGISADVTTVAGISADVTTVAGISADVTTVATNLTDITNFADVYLGPVASDPALRNDSSALVNGDLYFNTTTDILNVYDGAAWLSSTYNSSNVDINGGTIDGTVIGGTTLAAISGTSATFSSDSTINFITIGRGAGNISSNTASGVQALSSNTIGDKNTASGRETLSSNTIGSFNTASGYRALFSNTEGIDNTASGRQALFTNTTGNQNTVSGSQALYSNTIGDNNTASGYRALFDNTIGDKNTASGSLALTSNTEGNNNTAIGFEALTSSTTATNNTAFGIQALKNNTTGGSNTASGIQALLNNTIGGQNTASGVQALSSNTTGNNNTAIGFEALKNTTTGSGNTAISPRPDAGSYAPVFDPIGHNNRFCMGSTSVTHAYIQVAWTVVSDERDKTEMEPVPHGLDFVKELKPTSFRYKADRAGTEGHGATRYGFLAQDILALEGDNPVIIDNEDPEKLRMTDQSLIAVLVNAIQDQQKIIETLEGRITSLENT